LDGKDDQQKPTREMDPFGRFMFGNHKPRGSNQSQESTKPKDVKDDWFFGRRRKGTKETENRETHTTQNKLENMMNNVDIELLLETYDTLITTTEQYKPILKEIAPFFSQFTKKIKGKF
jgi:hypothetical protein